jgi:hypothetical protein
LWNLFKKNEDNNLEEKKESQVKEQDINECENLEKLKNLTKQIIDLQSINYNYYSIYNNFMSDKEDEEINKIHNDFCINLRSLITNLEQYSDVSIQYDFRLKNNIFENLGKELDKAYKRRISIFEIEKQIKEEKRKLEII